MYAKEPPDEAGRLHSRCREFAYSGSQLAFPGLPKQAIRTPRHAAHRGRARPGLVANFGSIFEELTRPGAGEELAGPRRSVRGCLPLSVVWNMRRRVDETHAELGSAACRLPNPRRRREGPGPRGGAVSADSAGLVRALYCNGHGALLRLFRVCWL